MLLNKDPQVHLPGCKWGVWIWELASQGKSPHTLLQCLERNGKLSILSGKLCSHFSLDSISGAASPLYEFVVGQHDRIWHTSLTFCYSFSYWNVSTATSKRAASLWKCVQKPTSYTVCWILAKLGGGPSQWLPHFSVTPVPGTAAQLSIWGHFNTAWSPSCLGELLIKILFCRFLILLLLGFALCFLWEGKGKCWLYFWCLFMNL